jgi:hypothetical protein
MTQYLNRTPLKGLAIQTIKPCLTYWGGENPRALRRTHFFRSAEVGIPTPFF